MIQLILEKLLRIVLFGLMIAVLYGFIALGMSFFGHIIGFSGLDITSSPVGSKAIDLYFFVAYPFIFLSRFLTLPEAYYLINALFSMFSAFFIIGLLKYVLFGENVFSRFLTRYSRGEQPLSEAPTGDFKIVRS